MPDYLVQATLAHDSGLPEDVTVNTWSMRSLVPPEDDAIQDFFNALKTFYAAIDQQLSNLLSGALTLKAYNRAHPTPRVPVLEDGTTLTPGTICLPSEVALCMSFQGAAISGAPQARRRGRVFLGPLVQDMNNSTTGRPDTGATHLPVFVAAADALLATSLASTTFRWVVWSTVNDSSVDVDNGWFDNAFDTMRSRGLAPTSRLTFDG